MVEDAHRIIGLYRRHASAWDERRRGRFPERSWFEKFLSLLPDTPSILDLGCGSGEPIGRFLMKHGCELTGIDASPELIGFAQDRLPAAEWIVSDMRALDLDRTFQGIVAWNSFFHLTPDDQRKMFSVFQRHAAANAALIFTSGPSHGEAIGEFEGEPLYHSSLDADEYRELLDRHGFEFVDHVVEDPNCRQQTIWLTRFLDNG